MKARTRTAVIVMAPLVAVATLALGLRVGAGSGFHAALVYAAPPGNAVTPGGGPQRYAWQIMTYFEERGVRETVPLQGLTVRARTLDGQVSTWTGSSNADGIAEVAFTFKEAGTLRGPGMIAIEVLVAGEKEPLALGAVDMSHAPEVAHLGRSQAEATMAVRPSKREGPVAIDVYIEGQRLVVGAPSSVWVKVTPPATADPSPDQAVPPIVVRPTPEIGVRFEEETTTTNGHQGWVELHAIALGQAASTAIEVTGPKGLHGTWFGTLPTAPGAFSIQLPPVVYKGEPAVTAVLVAPNPRPEVYLELDDERGRVLGAVLPLAVEPIDPLPRARFTLPTDLEPGMYWLVASGNPRGAEKMSGATIAKAFAVTNEPRREPGNATPLANVMSVADGFPRWLAIDGIVTRGAQNRSRHRRGLFIGLVALGAAALLELLLLTAASREARLALELAASDAPSDKPTARTPGLVVALLVALLGFAFLAALVIAKA